MENPTTMMTMQPKVEHRESYGTAKTENLRDPAGGAFSYPWSYSVVVWL